MTPMPWRSHAGSTASSTDRAKIEYCGCSHTKRSRLRRSATHWASTIQSAG